MMGEEPLSPRPTMSLILLKNCIVLDATRPEPRPGCDVVIEGETIREVSDRPLRLDVAEVVDVGGRTLIPGLIDAHMHAVACEVNLARLGDLPPSLVALEAHRILEDMLRRGFTTVRDAGGADAGLARAVEKGLIYGPRMFVSGRALSQTGGPAAVWPTGAARAPPGP